MLKKGDEILIACEEYDIISNILFPDKKIVLTDEDYCYQDKTLGLLFDEDKTNDDDLIYFYHFIVEDPQILALAIIKYGIKFTIKS